MEEFRTEMMADTVSPGNNQEGLIRFVVDIAETLLLAILLYLAINAVSARVRVDGSSMEPTLHNGEFVVVNKLAYRLGEPIRGEVIVFHFPRNPEEEYIKRVIGLPGDKVEVREGQVYVNDELIDEPYIAADPTYPGLWIVPREHLFVLGDNRNNSSDSHSWGTVPMEYVVGKAMVVYWPPPNWGIIEHTASAAP